MKEISLKVLEQLPEGTVFILSHKGYDKICMVFQSKPLFLFEEVLDELQRTKTDEAPKTPANLIPNNSLIYLVSVSEVNTLIGKLMTSQQHMTQ